ncbi:hypothetical protein GBAR_LOCUS29110, partial [Geodia barretti]
IEQVIDGVSASLETNNHEAVNLGLTFLSTVLQRQPATMSLFTSATSEGLQKLLILVHTALQTPATVLSSITTLSYLLWVCLEGKRSNGEKYYTVSEDVITFLSISFEQNLVPALLLKAEVLDRCEPFSVFFNIAKIQLDGVTEPPNTFLAQKLGNLGFIYLAFDIKSRFSTAPGGASLCGCVNECVESLCASLESDPQERLYIRETLHSALPHLNCKCTAILIRCHCMLLQQGELEKCLEVLLQRPPHGSSGCTSSLPQLQRAVLTLFYHTVHSSARQGVLVVYVCSYVCDFNCSVTSPVLVLQALDKFLVLNPDVHLMPIPSLTHLTALYAMTVQDTGVTLVMPTKATQGSQILVRALLRVASPGSLFSPNRYLLQWAFSQPMLEDITRTWFWEWLKGTCAKDDIDSDLELTAGCEEWSVIVQFIRTTPTSLDILLNVSTEEELTPLMISFLDHLLSEQQCIDSNSSRKVFSYVQKFLLAQRIRPLSDGATASLMKLLAKSIHSTLLAPDLKLVYHATNFVARCCSESIASGTALLCGILNDSKEVSSQVLGLLQNNTSFLERVVSCVPASSKPKDHSMGSANALRLIASLIYHQHKTKISCSQSGGVVPLQATLTTLIHHSPTINLSGLYFWRVVLCTGAYTGSFLLCDSNKRVSLGHDVQLVKKLCFLLQNCLVKDNKAVREACALCLVQLFKYITTGEGDRLGQGIGSTWNRVIIDHISTVSVNSHIPVYYLPCLETIICQTPPTHSAQLKDIAQLLYESAVNSTDATPVKYASCLNEVKKIDKTLLDVNQWTHLNKFVPQISQS